VSDGAIARQEVLVLYLANSSLNSRVVASSRFSGNAAADTLAGDESDQPYSTGTDAMRDGWRLFQASNVPSPALGAEHRASALTNEFWFEK
jgi:hypothetical protein